MKRRWAFKLMAFLLLGATVNVAVAWGHLLWPARDNSRPDPALREVDLEWWRSAAPPGLAEPYRANSERGFAFEVVSLWSHGPVATRGGVTSELAGTAANIRAGYPCRSFYGEWFAIPDTAINGWVKHSRWAIYATAPFLRIAPDRLPYLPWLPLWPGFAINTIFYAAILWLIFAAPRRIRRWRRIKRGLCPACAYPVGESEVCTECGAKLKREHPGGMGLPPPATPAPNVEPNT